MIFRTGILTLLLFLSFSVVTYPQEEDSTDNSLNWMAYPYIFYTPETDLAFGGGGILYFYLSPEYKSKASTITPSFFYSVNNQYEIVILPDLYFGYNEYHLASELRFGSSIDKYYGIGNSTPDIENPDYLLNAFKFKLDSEIKFLNAFILELFMNSDMLI